MPTASGRIQSRTAAHAADSTPTREKCSQKEEEVWPGLLPLSARVRRATTPKMAGAVLDGEAASSSTATATATDPSTASSRTSSASSTAAHWACEGEG